MGPITFNYAPPLQYCRAGERWGPWCDGGRGSVEGPHEYGPHTKVCGVFVGPRPAGMV